MPDTPPSWYDQHKSAVIGLAVVLCLLAILAWWGWDWLQTFAQVRPPATSTACATQRVCFGQSGPLTADQDPAPPFHLEGSFWKCYDTKLGKFIERKDLTARNTCIYYWQASPTGQPDAQVFCTEGDGSCTYRQNRCTGWLNPLKACAANQRGSLCLKDKHKKWRGWWDAQGLLGEPIDPGGPEVTVVPEIDCLNEGIEPGEWAPIYTAVSSSASSTASQAALQQRSRSSVGRAARSASRSR